MNDRNGARGWFIWVYVLALLLSIGLCVAGAVREELVVTALGVLGVVFTAASAPLAFLYAESMGAGPASGDGGAASLNEAIERLAEQQALSDDARRVLHRKRERDLLRSAIEEDIRAEDWDAALVLVDELAERFGYRADAEEFRGRIDDARSTHMNRSIAEAVGGLDRLIAEHRWADALAEAGRIARLYPDTFTFETLRQRVEDSHERYKKDLERRFLHAAGESRVEEAMATLKEMDAYLTEDEAAPFKEVARGVIGQARENLGVRFKLAVQDKQWAEAAEVGERIIAEFPNTRMSEEIRGVIDGIRQRAAAMRLGSPI